MEDLQNIRTALERSAKAISLRPGTGRGTAVTTVRLGPGLSCEAQDGPWRLQVGMPEQYGGRSTAPNPGVFGRTAVGACLALGYVMWAARMGVEIDSLEVEVQADYDARGELGVSPEVPPGYTEVRYLVRITSPEPEARILELLDQADRHSSWRDDMARAVPIRREVQYRPRGD